MSPVVLSASHTSGPRRGSRRDDWPSGHRIELIELRHSALSPEALRGVIEEFVTRPGTDYGEQERSVEKKIADVQRQLERSEAVIVFGSHTQTANIVPIKRHT